MTVSTTAARVSYSGNGITVAFAVPFPYESASELQVWLQSTSGSWSLLTGSHYSASASGTVTMVTAPASGETLLIVGAPPLTQPADFRPNDPFSASSMEGALDRGVRQIQWLQDQIDRTLRSATTDPAITTRVPALSGNDGKVLGLVSGALSWVNPDGSSSASNLGIPTVLSELTGSEFLVVQPAGTEGTAAARYVDIREILGLGYDRFDHVSSAAIADLDLIHTNVGAGADVTLTLPAADAGNLFIGYKARSHAFGLSVAPQVGEYIGSGGAGKAARVLEPGLFVLTCIETGYWTFAGFTEFEMET